MKESDHLEEVGIDQRVVLKGVLNKYSVIAWTTASVV
jgi:hypothetical protein